MMSSKSTPNAFKARAHVLPGSLWTTCKHTPAQVGMVMRDPNINVNRQLFELLAS